MEVEIRPEPSPAERAAIMQALELERSESERAEARLADEDADRDE